MDRILKIRRLREQEHNISHGSDLLLHCFKMRLVRNLLHENVFDLYKNEENLFSIKVCWTSLIYNEKKTRKLANGVLVITKIVFCGQFSILHLENQGHD